ncbi:ATP-binding protein [Patescibacteria group bacterium]|nr:MAG: ATP-binding protein [Patescibacteria group bacterium]
MPGKNKQLFRYLEQQITRLLAKKYSCLILGPRQVGKTTLINKALSGLKNKVEYFLQNPAERQELEANPGRIIRRIEAEPRPPYVFVDEAQKVPEIFDAAQYLIDKRAAQFIFTGSSARKLRRSGVNLLPGRIKRYYLDPLTWGELGLLRGSTIRQLNIDNINKSTSFSFEDSLVFGSLPGIVSLPEKERRDFLRSYAEIYLEEEIRAEALSRKVGAFSRFLELAAVESGGNPNFSKLSNESGASQPAIKDFYKILEDTLIVERVDPLLKNARKRILSTPRYYFFDIGARNSLSRFPLSPGLVNAQKGTLFEHAVILEIIRRIRALNKNYKVCYWRTAGGAEVDCVIDAGDEFIPIEIKDSPYATRSDLLGLKSFLVDYKKFARHGYVVTLGGKKEKLEKNITAVPWFEL